MLSINYVFFPGWPKHCASMEFRPIGRGWSCEGRCEGGPSENCVDQKLYNMVFIFFAISNHQFSLISIAGLVQWGFHVQQRQHQLLWVRDIKNSFFFRFWRHFYAQTASHHNRPILPGEVQQLVITLKLSGLRLTGLAVEPSIIRLT